MTETSTQWTSKGKSKTSEIANTTRKVIKTDIYYVIVGFEVNNPQAFVDETHDLDVDYGHAFFYTVKNSKITRMFSFGPSGRGKLGWFNKGSTPSNNWNTGAVLKDGAASSRQGTPDYGITEATRLFKISLTQATYDKLLTSTDHMRGKIQSGAEPYTAWLNDTCAETARDVLNNAGVTNPEGAGAIKKSGIWVAKAVNPYKWRDNFKKAGFKEVRFGAIEGLWKKAIKAIAAGTNEADPVSGEFRME